MKTSKILFCAVIVCLTSACGKMADNNYTVATNSTGYSQSTVSTFSDAQQCSSQPNVIGYDGHDSVSSEYSVCGTSNAVRVYAADQTTKTICAFPVNVSNGQVSVFINNPSAPPSNRYAYQCATVTPNSAAAFTFGTANFNGLYIVDQANAVTMSTCLAYGNVSACASNVGFVYSQGQFR